MNKYTFYFVCFTVMIFTGIVRLFAQDVADFKFRNIDEKTCIVVDYYGRNANVDIPANYNGKTVVEISGGYFTGAFEGKLLSSVVIPHSIKKIGENAFKGNSFSKINIGEGLDLAGVFDTDFELFYKQNGKRAGVYVKEYPLGWQRQQDFIEAARYVEPIEDCIVDSEYGVNGALPPPPPVSPYAKT